jgi:integrase
MDEKFNKLTPTATANPMLISQGQPASETSSGAGIAFGLIAECLGDFAADIETLPSTKLRQKYSSESNSHMNMLARRKTHGALVHEKFREFKSFLAFMGPVPAPGYTLDRLNSADPEYAPGKVRWASKKEQAVNKQNVILLTGANGVVRPLSEWAEVLKIPATTLKSRRAKGWTDAEVLYGKKSTITYAKAPAKSKYRAAVRYLSPDEEKRLRAALLGRDEHLRNIRSQFNDWRRARDLKPFPEIEPDKFGDHLHPIVLLALNTGMRRGEIFNLRWPAVDFEKALLEVEGPGAKSGRTRHIPLNTEAVETLRRWRGQSKSLGLVFPGPGGSRMTNINTSWASLVTRAKLDDFRFHDCRHHFASRLVMADVPLNTVRELLGHSEISMTLRYAHLASEHKADAVAKLVEKDSPTKGV